ncbi:MAG TPA: PIN domain-containing protein [Bryobacteraceae bacterium]|nr:PIN domain-containing protein [Bryobacteraceae bacterium]
MWFVDTNILLYSADTTHPSKQAAAQRWRDFLWARSVGRLSWQVLNEFYANAIGRVGIPPAVARAMVESYSQWPVSSFNMTLIRRAWHWTDHAQINYWDGLILAAAEQSGCRWLLTEDFQHGRKYGAVQVVNPFRSEPDGRFAS